MHLTFVTHTFLLYHIIKILGKEGIHMAQDRVRIADVADSLGLSTATVSKVIHGKTEKISDETVIYALSDFLIMILSWLVKQSLRAFLFQEVQL